MTDEDIDDIYQLRQKGYTAQKIGELYNCSADYVRVLARNNGFQFRRDCSDIGEPRPMYWCMRCKENRVKGRWQRCAKCNEHIREIGGTVGENWHVRFPY